MFRLLTVFFVACCLPGFSFAVDGKGNEPRCVEVVPGASFCEPFSMGAEGSTIYNIYYSVDYDRFAAQMAEYGLKPIRIEYSRSRKRGVVVLSFIDYFDTTIGPYREFTVSSLVQPLSAPQISYSSIRDFLVDPPKDFDPSYMKWGFLMHHLTIDGVGKDDVAELSIQGGRKLLGFPKSEGKVIARRQGQQTYFGVTNSHIGFEVKGHITTSGLFDWFKMKNSIEFHTISIDQNGQAFGAPTSQVGRGITWQFGRKDQLRVSGQLGQWLRSLDSWMETWSKNQGTNMLMTSKRFNIGAPCKDLLGL